MALVVVHAANSYGTTSNYAEESIDRDIKINQGVDAYRNGAYTNAMDVFLDMAEKGDPRGMYAVGSMYASGTGVKQDLHNAYQWLHKAALYNRWDAQYKTGLMHYQGLGVEQDYKKAARILRALAVKKNAYPPAQFRMGMLYINGHGVPQSNAEAYAWLVMAAHFYRQALAAEHQGSLGSGPGQKEIDEAELIAFELATVTDPITSVFAAIHLHEITRVLSGIRPEMTSSQLAETRGIAVQYRDIYQVEGLQGMQLPPVDDTLFMTDIFR